MKLIMEQWRAYLDSIESQNTLLREAISQTQALARDVSRNSDPILYQQYLENKNNIYIKSIDESNNKETWQTENLDKILENLFINNSKINEESIYSVLDESFDYESQMYFGEGLGDAIKKSYQASKERVKGAYKKGKLFFFLKIVESGLKLALTVSKGVIGLIRSIILKGIIMPLVKSNKSGAIKKIREWGKSKLTSLVQKVMKPFNWIALKITKNTKKAAELAPLLFSISLLSMLLGILYATAGIGAFEEASQVPSKIGIIDTTGTEVGDNVTKRAIKILSDNVNNNIDRIQTEVINEISTVVNFGGFEFDSASDTYSFDEVVKNKITETADIIRQANAQLSGVGFESFGENGMLDIRTLSERQQDIFMKAAQQAKNELGDYASKIQLPDAEMKAWANSIMFTEHVKSTESLISQTITVTDNFAASMETMTRKISAKLKNVAVDDVGDVTKTASPDSYLQEMLPRRKS